MQLNRPVRHLYSLHRKVDKVPFVIHLMRPDETSKTTLLSFTIRKDAHAFGNIFEQYKIERGEYPNNHFTYEKPFELEFKPMEDLRIDRPLEEISVEETPEEDLFEWCREQHMDLMVIHDLENVGKLQVMEFEVSVDDARARLENNLK